MPSLIKGTKHEKFKLRVSKDFPAREFKVEFTQYSVTIIKTGAGNHLERYSLRWRPLIGQMLLFRSEDLPEVFEWRSFTIVIKPVTPKLRKVKYQIDFSSKGIRVSECAARVSNGYVFWSWRALLTTALVGGLS